MNFIPAGQKKEVDGTPGPRLSSPHTDPFRIRTEAEIEAPASNSTKTEDEMPTLDAPVDRSATTLDTRIAELAAKYLPLAKEMLAEAIRIPADYVDKPVDQGGDPLCGLSNHEFPRLEYLRKKIIEIKAVRKPEDVFFDDFGNLVWWVEDPNDGIDRRRRRRSSTSTATPTPSRPSAPSGRRRSAASTATTASIDRRRSTRSSSRRSSAGSPPSPSGSTSSSAAAPRTSSAA